MNMDMPQWQKIMGKEGCAAVINWLVENVHRHGDLYDPQELMKIITGKDVTAGPYLKYLNEKYD
jgi:carboxypeptidase Taq